MAYFEVVLGVRALRAGAIVALLATLTLAWRLGNDLASATSQADLEPDEPREDQPASADEADHGKPLLKVRAEFHEHSEPRTHQVFEAIACPVGWDAAPAHRWKFGPPLVKDQAGARSRELALPYARRALDLLGHSGRASDLESLGFEQVRSAKADANRVFPAAIGERYERVEHDESPDKPTPNITLISVARTQDTGEVYYFDCSFEDGAQVTLRVTAFVSIWKTGFGPAAAPLDCSAMSE